MTPKPNHYVNNKLLYEQMALYIAKVREADAKGEERPRIPNSIGSDIWKIAEGLGKRPNFSGYSYLEEMKSDGIENCIQYIHNFNPDKFKNAFGYFNKIIWFAFLRRIEKEKKQQYIKYKLSCSTVSDSMPSSHVIAGTRQDHTIEMHKKMDAFALKFETDNNIKPKKTPKGLEKFIEDE